MSIRETELANANKVLEQHLSNTDDICKIVDAVYAMGRTIEERMGIKRFKKNNGKKLYWDWEHRMRTSCTARRPDLTLKHRIEKKIMIIDMACPNESNKEKKREEKMRKYQQLCYEIRERRDGYKVKIIPVVIGCLGGGVKRL